MNSTKVSIIIPVYNVEKYIEACFNSISNQTYKNIEAIFVDDCSSDDSYKILSNLIKQHSQSEIQYKILRHESNKNVSFARNTGIRAATGDYISFIDSDDIIIPNGIEYLLNIAKKYPTAEIIKSATISIFKKDWAALFPQNINFDNWPQIYGRILSCIDPKTRDLLNNISTKILFLDKMPAMHFWFERSLDPSEFIIPCGIWASLYNTDFLKKNNIYFSEDLPNNQDVYFRYLCFKNASQIVVPHMPIYVYRMRHDSLSRHSNKNYFSLECNAICMEKMLVDLCDERYSLHLSKWLVRRVTYCLRRINNEKEKTLVARFVNILNEINIRTANYHRL